MKNVLLAVVLLSSAAAASAQSVLVVDPAGPYTTIQSAIDVAAAGDTVLVSPGTYLETIDFLGKDIAVQAAGPGGPEAHVIDAGGSGRVVTLTSGEGPGALLEGFTVTGGVGAFGSEGPGGIDIAGSSPTIRGCRIAANQGAAADPYIGSGGAIDSGGHGGVRVTGGAPRLEGCVIQGNVGVDAETFGFPGELSFLDFASGGAGGLFIDGADVQLVDCVFRDNAGGTGLPSWWNPKPQDSGAGAVWLRSGTLVAERCSFEENVGGGLEGGAVRVGHVDDGPQPFDLVSALLVDCDFVGNSGGALRVRNLCTGSVRLQGCRLVGNGEATIQSASGEFCTLVTTLDDCLLIGNSGGPLVSSDDSTPAGPVRFEGCVITGHSNDGSFFGMFDWSVSVVVRNSIVWGNAAPVASASIESSCVEGGFAGPGNISADPLFVQPPAPGLDGLWGTDDDDLGDLRLSPGSPCIDAGDNLLAVTSSTGADPDGNLRFHDDAATADTGVAGGLGAGAVIDMGAYEHGSVPSPWADLGQGGEAPVEWTDYSLWGDPYTVTGEPAFLAAHGGLEGGEPTALRVETPVQVAGRLCLFVAGGSELGLPILGGTLIPDPEVVVTLFTDAEGTAQLDFPWPAGTPAGFSFFYQTWVDTSGAGTFTSTDALRSIVP